MISPTNFNILVSSVEVLIGKAWTDPLPLPYSMFCKEVPSGSAQNVYPWIGKFPRMRLWNGARVTYEPAEQTYTLKNQTFEHTIGVDRFSLDDDQYGVLQDMLPFQAMQARKQPQLMFIDLLENTGDQTGPLQLGLDGLTAFNTSHQVDIYNANQSSSIGKTYSNDLTGGGFAATIGGKSVTVGGAFGPTALATAIEYMQLYPGEDGLPHGINPNKVYVPTLLRQEADIVIKASSYAPPQWSTLTGQVGAAENPMTKWGLELVVDPYLTDPQKWYLMDTTRGFMPFIHQTREATRTVPRTQETDPQVFDSHRFVWGMWDRQAVGWGPSFLFLRSGP